MNAELYIQKLSNIKDQVVPTLFTERQFQVLIKHLKNQQLTQTEKNYLSNAIRHKLEAIKALKGLDLSEKERFTTIKKRIVASYKRAGITFHGAKTSKPYSATTTVKKVLANYEKLEARFINALPVFIAKELRNLNLLDIYTFSREKGITNFTGYIFSIANHFVKNPSITKFLRQWQEEKDLFIIARNPDLRKAKDIITSDEFSQQWNILTLNTIDSYRKYFELYA